MDPFRRNHSLNPQANSYGSEIKRRKDSAIKVAETDENEFPFLHNGVPTKPQDIKTEPKKNASFSNTPSFKKKILAERKEDPLPDSSLSCYLESTPQSKCMPCGDSFRNSPISSHSYDPITNYTSPRPKFLRYNPNQRRELLQRIEGEKRGNGEVWSPSSLSSPNSSSKKEDDNANEEEEEEEEEYEEEKPFYSYVVWSLLLLFGALLFISYCMSSNYHIWKIQGKTPLRLVGRNLFPENLLGSLMNLSQTCPIVGESLCNLDENLFVSLEIDRIIGREHLGKGESLIEGIRSELSNQTEVLVAEVQDLKLKNGGLIDDDSVPKEKMEHGDQNQRNFGPLDAAEGDGNKSIIRVETPKENNITSSSVESFLVSVARDVSDSLSTIKEDRFHNESNELSSNSQSRVEESTPTYDQSIEDFNFTLASATELKSDYSSSILSEGVLRTIFIFLGLLTIIIGLLSYFHKYFPREKLNSLHIFPSPPSESCLKTETGEKMVTSVQMKEENMEKALDISVESKSSRLNYASSTSDHMNVELKKVSGFEPPREELHGEFSHIDAEDSNNGLGSYLRKMEYSNSHLSYYQKGKARKMLSPFPYMLDSSPETSTSSRFSSKVPADKGEISDNSATSSLRRSSRLRNQNRVI